MVRIGTKTKIEKIGRFNINNLQRDVWYDRTKSSPVSAKRFNDSLRDLASAAVYRVKG